MPTIALTISTVDVEPPRSEKAAVELSAANIDMLRRYAENYERLVQAQLFETGLPTIKQIKFDQNSGMSITVSDFKYGDLCELLHLARPLLLAEEPASFERTIALLGKQCESKLFRRHLKNVRNIYSTGDYGRYFQMTINGVPLFTDEAARLWLNGVEYHQDQEKAEETG